MVIIYWYHEPLRAFFCAPINEETKKRSRRFLVSFCFKVRSQDGINGSGLNIWNSQMAVKVIALTLFTTIAKPVMSRSESCRLGISFTKAALKLSTFIIFGFMAKLTATVTSDSMTGFVGFLRVPGCSRGGGN